jgi:hypothetical protein
MWPVSTGFNLLMSNFSSRYRYESLLGQFVKDRALLTDISRYLHRFYVHSAIEVFDELAKILFKRVDFLSGFESDNRTCGPSCSEIRFGEVM